MHGQSATLFNIEDFGSLLKYLRRRARLTQKELSIAVGYSESQISRLESNEHAPDKSAITALFIPALGLELEPEVKTRNDLASECYGNQRIFKRRYAAWKAAFCASAVAC